MAKMEKLWITESYEESPLFSYVLPGSIKGIESEFKIPTDGANFIKQNNFFTFFPYQDR